MPLELIELETGRKILSPGDRGFLISLAKARWGKHAANEAVKLLKGYAQAYYEKKCPEVKPEPKEDAEEKEASTAGDDEKRALQTQNSVENGNTSGIQFVQRELVYNNCGFIACNLADPSDFAHFVLTKLAEAKKDKRTKFPYRIMPVQSVCEARPKAIEKIALPLIESTLGLSDQPFRFSLMFRGYSDGDNFTQQEAKALIRNCVWSVNPNCVQCIKFQDYAIMIDILNPLFCIGIAKDFQRLAGYNTWNIRQGLDLTDQGEDSEDEISDDPNLDEEEEKKRKLRIKRKRRAEKAGLGQPEGPAKRSAEGDDEEEGDHGEEQDGNEEGDEDEDIDDGGEDEGVENEGVENDEDDQEEDDVDENGV